MERKAITEILRKKN